MTLADRIESQRARSEVDSIWKDAIEEAVVRRVERKFKGFHRLAETAIPLEAQVGRNRIRRGLLAEIAAATWRNDEGWKRVEASFRGIRSHFVSMVRTLDIPRALRRDWVSRLESVRLVIPGSLPEIADTECASMGTNAYYYTRLNLLTVCAGDFNSEDILQTVAHELAHSLDPDRSRYLAQRGSALGKGLAALRVGVCSSEGVSCENWSRFKKELGGQVERLGDHSPELPEFESCLMRRTATATPGDADIERISRQILAEQVSGLAASDVFLALVTRQLPRPNGQVEPNPNYLNPCGFYPWSRGEESVDDDLTQLIFFTAEYRCATGSPAERLASAIRISQELAHAILRGVIAQEGRFSPRSELEAAGFASSPSERFADLLGSYALASYLEAIPSLDRRREIYLASSSWQCKAPSLASQYPEETRILSGFVLDPHTDGDLRVRESLSGRVRRALACSADFKFSECELRKEDGSGLI
jgi:hypothetical protein